MVNRFVVFTIHAGDLQVLPRHLRSLLYFRTRMPLKRSRWSKLAQLVANHILGDVNRQMSSAIVNTESEPNHLRRDCRAPGPGLDHRWTLAASARLLDSLLDTRVNVGTFFY
jgi:hypothetical protein